MKVWYALEIGIGRAAEAPVAAQLWTAGTTGIEISEDSADAITLRAYFDAAPDEDNMREAISKALEAAGLPRSLLRDLRSLTIADQDWLAEWKKGYEPVAVGERLLIVPSWKRDETGAVDRVVVQIDPGLAFGTGTHETTRGCLEMLERYWRGGAMLDVGTGTGILAMAAIKLRPGARVTGFDVDPEAVEVARENAEINGVADELEIEVNKLSFYNGSEFDLVTANLTADVLVPMSRDFSGVMKSGGVLIASGILTEQREEVESAFAAAGFVVMERMPDGEWVTLALRENGIN
ncbi:MAG: 50S ribosomal protein L11 methyltransferase [Acidobacteria bacterium]|nr:50S ribosomal protein L11 methyltransferase [Acidobacteriota bacterium]MCW5970996.1 50S ribosomal protein L11 methyltransferase [Blastocatellales bacterium]